MMMMTHQAPSRGKLTSLSISPKIDEKQTQF